MAAYIRHDPLPPQAASWIPQEIHAQDPEKCCKGYKDNNFLRPCWSFKTTAAPSSCSWALSEVISDGFRWNLVAMPAVTCLSAPINAVPAFSRLTLWIFAKGCFASASCTNQNYLAPCGLFAVRDLALMFEIILWSCDHGIALILEVVLMLLWGVTTPLPWPYLLSYISYLFCFAYSLPFSHSRQISKITSQIFF